jgi:hypothetical protein
MKAHTPAMRWLMASQEDKDAASRIADAVNLHRLADYSNVGKWVACRLSDGTSDGVAYDPAYPPSDPRAHAIRHQLHESQCCYVQVQPTGMSKEEALIFLQFNRNLYARGMRMTDPPPPPQYIFPPNERN